MESHESDHRRRSRGRRFVRRAPAPARRERGDPHGGARALRLVRELRPAVLHRRRDRARKRASWSRRRTPSATCSPSTPHGLRGGRPRRRGEDRPAQGPGDRRGDHRDATTSSCSRRGGAHPPAAARDRPARDLRGADGAGRRARSAPGSRTARTELPGIDSYTGFQTRKRQRRAVVVGGGFIGIETAENLVGLGFEVTPAAARRPDHGAARPRDGALRGAALGKHGVRVPLHPRRPASSRRRTVRSRSSPRPARSIRRTS